MKIGDKVRISPEGLAAGMTDQGIGKVAGFLDGDVSVQWNCTGRAVFYPLYAVQVLFSAGRQSGRQ